GVAAFENISFNLNNLLESVLDGFLYTANKHNTRLYVNLDEHIPEMIKGDPGRLTQILNNLVSYAIQRSETERVGITAEKLESNSTSLTLLFTIGEAMAEVSTQHHQIDVSTSFYESDHRAHTFDNAGVRLAISKKLIELQNGHIYVRNDHGKSNTF